MLILVDVQMEWVKRTMLLVYIFFFLSFVGARFRVDTQNRKGNTCIVRCQQCDKKKQEMTGRDILRWETAFEALKREREGKHFLFRYCAVTPFSV
jgi:hypothetical protein